MHHSIPIFEIQRYDGTANLPLGCEILFGKEECNSFDLSADWFQLLRTTVFSEKCPQIYVLQRGSEVRGLLPLYFRRTGMWQRQVSSLSNYYSSLYRPLLSQELSLEELAGCLQLVLKDAHIDSVRFDAMDPAHPTFELLESACRLVGLKPYRFFCFGNWYLPVQGRSFEEYFQGLSSQIRNTVRRRKKKFFAAERGKLEIVTGNDGLEAAIAAWSRIYGTSWKKAEPYPAFVTGLIRMCAARGWLRLGLAYYDGNPIAGQIWIVSHGRAAIYKLAYDNTFAHLSAGTLLTAHLMRHVLDEDKVQEVDYLRGDDTYKKDWMSHRRERWGLVAYNLHTLGGLACAGANLIREAFKRLINGAQVSAAIARINSKQAMTNNKPSETTGWTTVALEKSLGPYKDAWDALNAELYASHPFFDSSFIEPLLTHFSDGRARLCIHRRNTEIDGLLLITPSRAGKWSVFIPAQAQICPLLVRHPEDLLSLVPSLPSFSLALDFPCQDPLYSPSFNTVQSWMGGAIPHTHTISVKLEGEFKDYWGGKGKKKLRGKIGRYLRMAKDAGYDVRLKRVTDLGGMQPAITRFGEMESAGWKGRNGTAIHSGNVQGQFYTEVMSRFAGQGSASVYELYFNEALVAMQLCIASPSMLILLKTTYDESQAKFSPGRLLDYLLLEEAFAEKRVDVVEFYTDASSEQLTWATHDRYINHQMLFRNILIQKTYQLMQSPPRLPQSQSAVIQTSADMGSS